jgi:hypothetical protein
VVWQDIAQELRAAAVPAQMPDAGALVPIIPLNSVYFIAVDSPDKAFLLAAFLNSLPLRVFACTIAERAKDAHFRFFSWTIGGLPLPRDWEHGARAAALISLSRDAHAQEGLARERIDELDAIVAGAYGLSAEAVQALAQFDAWLRPKAAA